MTVEEIKEEILRMQKLATTIIASYREAGLYIRSKSYWTGYRAAIEDLQGIIGKGEK